MREALKTLMEQGVPAPPQRALAPAVAAAARRRRTRRRSWSAVAIGCCAALAAGAVALTAQDAPDTARLQYATADPELGTTTAPDSITVDRGRQVAVTQADVLARLGGPEPQVLLGLRLVDGRTCLSLSPPEQPGSSTTSCPPANESAVTVLRTENGLGFAGMGPGGAPGLIKSLPVTYGVAPAGTRTIVIEPTGGDTIRVGARDGGQHYDNAAFFLANFDLGVGGDIIALDAEGRELSRRSLPASTASRVDCDVYRSVTRSHLSRALAVGRSYAEQHPEFDDPARLAPPVSGRADTAAGVSEMLARNLDAPTAMAPEERYEHRLAALVVLEAPQCWDDPALPALAERFLEVSN